MDKMDAIYGNIELELTTISWFSDYTTILNNNNRNTICCNESTKDVLAIFLISNFLGIILLNFVLNDLGLYFLEYLLLFGLALFYWHYGLRRFFQNLDNFSCLFDLFLLDVLFLLVIFVSVIAFSVVNYCEILLEGSLLYLLLDLEYVFYQIFVKIFFVLLTAQKYLEIMEIFKRFGIVFRQVTLNNPIPAQFLHLCGTFNPLAKESRPSW